jgi:predicted nucleic acid-binding protein
VTYLVDTNVISELRRQAKGRADPNVVRWASAQPSDSMYVSALTLFELERGVLLVQRRDPAQARVLRKWLDEQVLPAFAGRVLPVDGLVSKDAAALHVPDPVPLVDSLIAATALAFGLTVATRNEADFARFSGLAVINPWTAEPDSPCRRLATCRAAGRSGRSAPSGTECVCAGHSVA